MGLTLQEYYIIDHFKYLVFMFEKRETPAPF